MRRRRRRAAHRVPRDRRPRAAAADRRARPGDGAPHAVRRPPARRVPRLGRARRRRHQRRPRRASTRRSVRLHVCWGNYEGPHTHDVAARRHPAAALRGPRRRARASRWPTPATPTSTDCFERRPLPDGMALVAGVIDTTSNYVEHPEVVADRLATVSPRRRRPAPGHRRHRLRLRHLGRASATSPRRSCGRSSPRCAPAPTWPPSACSERSVSPPGPGDLCVTQTVSGSRSAACLRRRGPWPRRAPRCRT